MIFSSIEESQILVKVPFFGGNMWASNQRTCSLLGWSIGRKKFPILSSNHSLVGIPGCFIQFSPRIQRKWFTLIYYSFSVGVVGKPATDWYLGAEASQDEMTRQISFRLKKSGSKLEIYWISKITGSSLQKDHSTSFLLYKCSITGQIFTASRPSSFF